MFGLDPSPVPVGIYLKPWQHFVPCSLTLGVWLGLGVHTYGASDQRAKTRRDEDQPVTEKTRYRSGQEC